MKWTLSLKRYPHQEPDIRQMDLQLSRLERLVNHEELWKSPQKDAWLDEILAFQAEDGSFALVDSPRIESDARVYYYYEPSYLCSALLMRELLSGSPAGRVEEALKRSLGFCRGRGMQGHGFDAQEGEEKAMGWFLRCGLEDFLYGHPVLDAGFRELADKLMMNWTRVFVYGTLMSTGARHMALARAVYEGRGRIKGYTLYDLGAYPAARQGGGDDVLGEVYHVHRNTLRALDRIEGQGTLYRRYPANVYGDRFKLLADAYLYIHDLNAAPVIPQAAQPYGGKPEDLVWYAAYGSNINQERLACYIQGGTLPQNGKHYKGCADKTLPRLTMPLSLPHERYFAKASSSWGGSGVAFLDTGKAGGTLGRGYLMTREQYRDIRLQEGPGWYDHDVLLGFYHGIEVRTLTHSTRFAPEREPLEAYLQVMEKASWDLSFQTCFHL